MLSLFFNTSLLHVYSSRRIGLNQPNIEVAISKVLIGLVAIWMITWTPYALVALLGISGYSHLLTPFSSMMPALFAKTAACVDPFIYSLNHPRIRQEILFRFYNCFVPSAERRGEPAVRSNSGPDRMGMFSGSSRFMRQNMLHNGKYGRSASSLASSRRFRKGQHNSLSVVKGIHETRHFVSLSSAKSCMMNAGELDMNEIIDSSNQDPHRQFRCLLAVTEIKHESRSGESKSLAIQYSPTVPHLVLTTAPSKIMSTSV